METIKQTALFPAPNPDSHGLVLAPMEGITDAPMRAVLTERGGYAYCVTEFLRVTDQTPPKHVLYRHVPELAFGCKTPSGTPIQIQLLGSNPERLAETAAKIAELGGAAIDLNFGCPAPTVNRHEGGAILLKHPDKIHRILSTVRMALPSHVFLSAKLRLGWDTKEPILTNALAAQDAGAAWITIHGRTRMAGYAPPADWERIGAAREAVQIPVIANGEIWNLEELERCRKVSGCTYFMLGRGALADPLLGVRAEAWLNRQHGDITARFPREGEPWAEWFQNLSRRVESSWGEKQTASRMKQWANFAGKPYGKLDWFDEIKVLQLPTEILAKLSQSKGPGITPPRAPNELTS